MERVIETVRTFPCLWNTEIHEYKLNDFKDAAWREVVKKCDLPDVKEAKSIWRKLRDGHRQAVARKKLPTGQATNSKSKWKYEKQMEFLLPSMKNRPKIANVEMQNDNQDSNDEAHQNEDHSESEHREYNDTVFISPTNITVSPQRKEPKGREFRYIQRDAFRKQTKGDAKSAQNCALDKFFMSMLLSTSQLPERLQLRVQRQIFNSVMEAKEESLTNQFCNSSASPSASRVYLPTLIRREVDSPHVYSSISNYTNVNAESESPSHFESQPFNTIKCEQNCLTQDIVDSNIETNVEM